jgi:hypothetical protein
MGQVAAAHYRPRRHYFRRLLGFHLSLKMSDDLLRLPNGIPL